MSDTFGTTAVIIMNYKRPQNIGGLVTVAAQALPGATIFVLDQGEGPNSLKERDDVPLNLCWVRSQANVGPGVRFRLAAEWPFDHYLCIDDDTFLTALQIRALMFKLQVEPERAHGVTGQLLTRYPNGDCFLKDCIDHDTCISVLNRVYAFTRERAQATLRLAEVVGYARWEDVKRTEDVLLTCAGRLPSRVHNLGPYGECSTNSTEGIATYLTPGFREERLALVRQLMAMNAIYVAEGTDPPEAT